MFCFNANIKRTHFHITMKYFSFKRYRLFLFLFSLLRFSPDANILANLKLNEVS